MRIFAALRRAFEGWILIAKGEPGWQERFRFSPAGLATALVLFYLFAFLAVVIASLEAGVPTLQGLFDIMLIQSLWLLALAAGIFGTRAALRDHRPPLVLVVPGIYVLVFYLVAGTLVSLTIGLLLPLLWLALVFLLYRLGRAATQWTPGVSAAFALLTVVLLVGLPMTLYMLTAPTLPAA
ncbi:MAG: hypothetical protein ABS75_00785 [Pelagibacterium sp. SCN 63-23]|nr:MAG: hypothetical protein ABS75_00785 [Pelagibacterium sp. SCN 63-23]